MHYQKCKDDIKFKSHPGIWSMLQDHEALLDLGKKKFNSLKLYFLKTQYFNFKILILIKNFELSKL